MKAFVKSDPAGSSITATEVPAPEVDTDDLLVRMHAVGVGIHDSYFLPADAGPSFPIGMEGAGVVEQVGPGVTQHRPGDRVAFVNAMEAKGGTWAEYAVVNTNSLILPVPDGLDFVEAAALPVAGNTILRTLAALPGMQSGSSLFVAGGAGAIGSLAIQIARQRGWRVAASASAHNHDYMRSLGAELTVDYHDSDWPEQVRGWLGEGVDAAIAIHPGTSTETMRAVKDGGTIVPVSGDSMAVERGIRAGMIAYQADVSRELDQLMADVVSKAIHLEIERVYPFDEAADALARVQTRHARGKLVLRLP
ncbi:NADP-dependent oxidoreductase [Janibacter cremeus]|uniref:NADPH:quinone reductase-like Zn-dependent oxidoreductase n=1 Tax=Janibacter cremeus TaxID=1285192 RepID=A0A852VN91_9MICO|nr:NADP-dependent oxidoreductase [Janibacter cremeus]NYF96920.1 NADPH:quinone reductase-like Zn-dependent oxidoreductase [Janibacter cremeus]